MRKTSAYDLRAQQRRLNSFVKEYNHIIRPHEALDMETPASEHDFSTRPFPEKIPNFDYESEMKVYKVTKNGSMRWGPITGFIYQHLFKENMLEHWKWDTEFGEFFIEMYF